MPNEKTKKQATKKKAPTTKEEIRSLQVRMFEAEKQIDALNTAITVVAIASRARPERVEKIDHKQYESFVFKKLHPMINKGNQFIHKLLEERGLLNETKE